MPSQRPQTTRSAEADLQDIRRCLGGEGGAYRALVERHQQQVSAIMWRFARDPDTHEDLVQEVFIEAYSSLAGYRARAPFSHWISRIATRVGYRHWRRERRERVADTVPLEEWHDLAEEPPDDVDPAEAGRLLYQLLERLPPRDRLVLTLRFVEGHSVEKTAEMAGWSEAMVKVQTWRARKKLLSLFQTARREAEP